MLADLSVFAVSCLAGAAVCVGARRLRALEPSFRRGARLGREVSGLLRSDGAGAGFTGYKWFDGLVVSLLGLRRGLGVPIDPCLRRTRDLLAQDVRLERRRFGDRASSLFEFAMVSLMTAAFHACFGAVVGEAPPGPLAGALALQALGGALFLAAEPRLHRRAFRDWDALQRSLMKLSVLSAADLPTQRILDLSLDGLPKAPRSKEAVLIRDGLLSAAAAWKERGDPIGEELDFQMAELDGHREHARDRFLKFAGALRFACLALFFLPGYLHLVLGLAGSLMVD